MDVHAKMFKQLQLTVEKKVMTDDVKALERMILNMGKKLNRLQEDIGVDSALQDIHDDMSDNLTEFKKVLKANELL